MTSHENIQTIEHELETAIELTKCQQCGCMLNALQHLATALPMVSSNEARLLETKVSAWLPQMRPIQYACLGCEHCYPAVAQNALPLAFPDLASIEALACEFHVQDQRWPAVVGEYLVVNPSAPVAVSTLASGELPAALVKHQSAHLAIVGKTETENIGIDKIVKNTISNPALHYLVVAGIDPKGHLPGQTLLALAQHGIDDNGRVIEARGKHPILRNVSLAEIQAFREQVQVIDLIGCEDPVVINARLEALAQQPTSVCRCSTGAAQSPISVSTVPKLIATEPSEVVTLDKAGYFVIVPQVESQTISVEHYAYNNTLLHNVEGTTARAIYHALIENGWVTELTHAAYLGKELAKAEFAIQHDLRYVQDGA